MFFEPRARWRASLCRGNPRFLFHIVNVFYGLLYRREDLPCGTGNSSWGPILLTYFPNWYLERGKSALKIQTRKLRQGINIPVNPELCSIVCNCPIACGVSKHKAQRYIIVLREVQLETGRVERYPSFRDAFLGRTRRPCLNRWIGLREALSFGVEAPFIQGTTHLCHISYRFLIPQSANQATQYGESTYLINIRSPPKFPVNFQLTSPASLPSST